MPVANRGALRYPTSLDFYIEMKDKLQYFFFILFLFLFFTYSEKEITLRSKNYKAL